ncbi:MAG: hypothetical protein KAR05_11320 [Candidatus Omnitrophica bacterium]|nr:hypothetical protein [Candidatus Omnitrophota bacterium]
MNKKKLIQILIHVLVPIFIGSLIYLMFRNSSLLVFNWIDFCGAKPFIFAARNNVLILRKYIPDFFLYSLPDGIWVYSCTFALLIIWKNCLNNLYGFFWIFIPLLCSLGAEFLQLFGMVEGTFCLFDITAYISFFCLALYFNKERRNIWAAKY